MKRYILCVISLAFIFCWDKNSNSQVTFRFGYIRRKDFSFNRTMKWQRKRLTCDIECLVGYWKMLFVHVTHDGGILHRHMGRACFT